MNEKNLKRIVYVNDVDNTAYIEAEGGYTSQEQILTDIARQLTIANEIEQEKNDKTFCIAYGKGLEMGKHQKSANSANIRLEILAKAFFHDTGIVAPHKIQRADAVSSGHSIEERKSAWHKWLKENDVPEPAPQTGLTTDALVEACKKLIRNADNDENVEAMSDMSGWTKSVWVTRKDLTAIESLVADHEKAVT